MLLSQIAFFQMVFYVRHYHGLEASRCLLFKAAVNIPRTWITCLDLHLDFSPFLFTDSIGPGHNSSPFSLSKTDCPPFKQPACIT